MSWRHEYSQHDRDNPFAGTPFEQWAQDFVASFTPVVSGDDVLRDTPEQRRRDAEADELARKMEE